MLPLYEFTTPESATLSTDYYIRQNACRTDTYTTEMVLKSQKLHVPHAHTMGDVLSFSCEPTSYLQSAHPQVRRTVLIPTDTLVLYAGHKEALIVRLTSPTKGGYCDPIYVAREPITGATISFLCMDDMHAVTQALAKGYQLEPFYTLYREIEIVGRVRSAEDWRTVAQTASCGHCRNWMRPVSLLEEE